MKPLKGSKFLGSGPLRTALGWWKQRGQRECLEVGALWWAAGVHKANTQRERELGGGAFHQSLLYVQRPRIFIPW